jgi:hypothetical protein
MRLSGQWLRKCSVTAPFKIVKINPAYASMRWLLDQLPEGLSQMGETVYRARNEIKVLTVPEGKIVIKAFGKIYLFNRFAYAWLRPSKAKRSFEYALELEKRGVDTPPPIGYLECYRGGLLRENMYVYNYCPRTHDLREMLRDKDYPDRDQLLQALARYACSLIRRGVYHRDFSPGNVLFTRDEGGYHFTLIDINRIHFGPVSSEKKYRIFRRLMTDEHALTVLADAYAACLSDDPSYVRDQVLSHAGEFARKRARKKKFKKLLRFSQRG